VSGRTLTVTRGAKIAALRAAHGVVAHAAAALGVHRVTLARWIAADPDLREELEIARAVIADLAETRLRAILEDEDHPQHFDAIVFTLRTLGRDRGYVVAPPARPRAEQVHVQFYAPAIADQQPTSATPAQEAHD